MKLSERERMGKVSLSFCECMYTLHVNTCTNMQAMERQVCESLKREREKQNSSYTLSRTVFFKAFTDLTLLEQGVRLEV